MPVIIHTGFWTYVLIVVILLVVIALVYPPLFQSIVNAITELVRALRGGAQVAPFGP
jgi:hypothetical protein